MGSKSQSSQSNADKTTSTALQRDNVLQTGTQIADSIVIDPSDVTMKAMIDSFKAQFETLVAGNAASTAEAAKLAKSVLDLADRNQVEMSQFGYNSLKSAIEFMDTQLEQGKFMLDFQGVLANESYNLAGKVVGQQGDTVDKALGILSNVKTGDFADTFKTLSGYVLMFTLAALYLSLRSKNNG